MRQVVESWHDASLRQLEIIENYDYLDTPRPSGYRAYQPLALLAGTRVAGLPQVEAYHRLGRHLSVARNADRVIHDAQDPVDDLLGAGQALRCIQAN